MNRIRCYLVTLFFVAACFPVSAMAQQTEQPVDDGQSQNQEDTATEDVANEEQADEGEQDDRPDIDNQPIESGANNRPGRFVPSEQISLDLGVSFPVDV